MPQNVSLNSQNVYEITVYGQLNGSWLEWFGDAKHNAEALTDAYQATTFSEVVMDQAGLVGLIRRLHSIGVVLISVRLLTNS